jgi:hypothetical protein
MIGNLLKKQLLLIIILVLPFAHLAQKSKRRSSKTKPEDRYHSLALIAGQNIYSKSLSPKINDLGSYKISKPKQKIGIQWPNSGMRFQGTLDYYGSIEYSYMLPVKIIMNDSLSCRLNGFNFAMDIYAFSFFEKSEVVLLKAGLGFNTGRLTLSSAEFRQKNPFFAPQVSVYNGYTLFHRFSIGFSGSYFYDISKTSWKRTFWLAINQSTTLKPFNQSGIQINLSLGWV